MDKDVEARFKGIENRLERLDDAIEALSDALTGTQITAGRLESIRRRPPDGDGLEKISDALERIAVGVSGPGTQGPRRKTREEVTRALEFIATATGYRTAEVTAADSFFWIDPRSARPGASVTLYGSTDLEDVTEIRVAGHSAAITEQRSDELAFTVPRTSQRGPVPVHVDIGRARAAWKTELVIK